VKKASDINGDRTAKRAMRAIAACALVLASALAHAGPPAGTPIANQATATGQFGAAAVNAASNIVTLTTTAAPLAGTPFASTLDANRSIVTPAGTTVYARHVLTNVGNNPDTFTLSTTALGGDYALTSITLYADANDDGLPDSAAALANPVVLAPGQSLRFVMAMTVPMGAPGRALSRVRLSAASLGSPAISTNTDEVTVRDTAVLDCASATKVLSRYEGPSPGGPVTVTLRYSACDKARGKVMLTDRLPAGMRYVAGSGRWMGGTTEALTDGVVGDDLQGTGGTRIAYDWNVTTAGAVTATITNIPVNGAGSVLFDVEIDAAIAVGTSIPNTASYVFYDGSGNYGGQQSTNTVNYLVNGRVDLELTGQRLPTANPGAAAIFTNVLTNRGTATETFDITLSGSTFPAGTTLALYKADGVTPLTDTDGNGTPDSGPLAPGASYNIVVRALIPATAPPAVYKVTKTARAASAPMRFASADDVVDTIALKCALVLDPDNQATIGRGQHVTYTHYLANRGNCVETVTAGVDYLADSQAGWKSAAYLDTKNASEVSVPGALDPSDVRIGRGWTTSLQPAETLRLLVDVLAPETIDAKAAKAVTQSNLTKLVVTSSGTGNLTVRDTTIIDDKDQPAQPDNAIRNFTDSTYSAPTLWGIMGGTLWLRADASSCNAVANVIESRIVVITGPNGEREEVTATETGANTGIFTVPALPVRSPAVVAGDGTLQGRAGETFESRSSAAAATSRRWSRSWSPPAWSSTAAATTRRRRHRDARHRDRPNARAPRERRRRDQPVLTGANGRYAFPRAGRRLLPRRAARPTATASPRRCRGRMLPPARNLNVTGLTSGGSYGHSSAGRGRPGASTCRSTCVAQDGLFVQKDASRFIAEIGDSSTTRCACETAPATCSTAPTCASPTRCPRASRT
jgi:hypothetical protein